MTEVWVRKIVDEGEPEQDAHWIKLFGQSSFTGACATVLAREQTVKVALTSIAPSVPGSAASYSLPEKGPICAECERKRREQA